jgi:signal transduction histidine kinase
VFQKQKIFRLLLLFFIIGLFLVSSWVFVIAPVLKNDISRFQSMREYSGDDAYAENIGDSLSETYHSHDLLEYEIKNVNGNILEIASSYTTRDITTDKIIYDNHNTYFVDFTTGKHVNTDYYFNFPINVQKQDYLLLDPTMEVPATFVFEGIKYIDDLEVYVFSCKNLGSDFSSAWTEFAPVIIYGDQTCNTSIEPITGKTVQFLITWDMYAIENGEHISIEVGKASTTPFTERILLQSAISAKNVCFFYDYIVPIFLIVILISVFFIVLYLILSKEKDKIIIKQLEDLHKNERLNAIGHLSSRMAHDIRNPLSVIKLSTDFLKQYDQDLGKNHDKHFSAINDAILRITHQIDNVLEFIQKKPLKLENTSVSDIVDIAINACNIPSNIKVEKITDDGVISCDKHLISIVFINILSNAIFAIGQNSGKIIIHVDSKSNDRFTKVKISNDGPNIPDDVLPKIFEPLFTTKQEGTGLGLASCKSIVEQHNGTIMVANNPVTFTISLPKTNRF